MPVAHATSRVAAVAGGPAKPAMAAATNRCPKPAGPLTVWTRLARLARRALMSMAAKRAAGQARFGKTGPASRLRFVAPVGLVTSVASVALAGWATPAKWARIAWTKVAWTKVAWARWWD